MTIPSNNDELFAAFKTALEKDGADAAEAQATADKLRALMAEHKLRNPSRLAEGLSNVKLDTGDMLVLRQVLELNAQSARSSAPVVAPAAPSGPQTMKVVVDKAPHEMRNKELIELFAVDKQQDVVSALESRFGETPFLVMSGASIDVTATLQRLDERDTSLVYDGKVVETITRALAREYAADPLEGVSAKLMKRVVDGREVWKATDGVCFTLAVCIHANHSRAHVLMLNDTGSMRVYECSRDTVHSAERERLWSPE